MGRGEGVASPPPTAFGGVAERSYLAAVSAPSGFRLVPQALDPAAQAALVREVEALTEAAPFRRYETPWGKAMSVEMTSFGPLGWTSSRAGYRYTETDPKTGRAWPAMPPVLVELWRIHARSELEPDSALVNLYRGPAKMGLHQDRDEDALAAPVLSISLGDTAVFRIGGTSRSEPTSTVRLASGDLCVLEGEARLAFHGVDRTLAGSSRLLSGGGRINITLRRARR